MAQNGRSVFVLVTFLLGAALAALSCSSNEGNETAGGTGAVTAVGGSGAGGGGGSGGIGVGGSGGTQGPFSDFPKTPQIDSSLPSDLPSQFGAPGNAGGPCLSEPPIDALVPRNWTPLLFEWSAPPEQNVFELRLHVDNQTDDLVVYTSQKTYTIAGDMWKNLTSHSAGHDIAVSVRGGRLEGGKLSAGPFDGTSGAVHIAPVAAPGSVVYWSIENGGTGSTALKGFSIGDSKVSTVLTPAIVGGDTNCVACHVSAPDGKYTFYVRDGSNSTTRSVDVRSVDGKGSPPPSSVVSPTALALLGRSWQSAPVTSKAHYSASDAVLVSVFIDASTSNKYELIWTDLHASSEAGGWGILARTGDPRQVASPTWWHDGSTIAYTSSANAGEGVISSISDADPTMDIYTIPYNNRQGGAASPLPGASDAAYWEYYPVISPGDTLLAFNRCAPKKEPSGAWADSYNEPTGEVMVVSAKGGTAVRLSANDPPACTGKTSPGLTNSWPRWAPTAEEFGGKKYYWIVFSSIRRETKNPQLFVAGIVTSESGGVVTIEKTHPALYVSAQTATDNNHTPAWDVFQVGVPR